MNRLQLNLLFFFSIFPVFIIRTHLSINDLFLIILIFFVFLFLNKLVLILIAKDFNNIFFQTYLAVLISLGIDLNLGLHYGFVSPIRNYFQTDDFIHLYYLASFVLVIVFLINFFIVKMLKLKGFKILFSFLVIIFIFNIFDNTKNSKNILNFDNAYQLNKKVENTKLIIITDEMAGVNSLESKTKEGMKFDKLVKKFSEKFNFNLYTNIYSKYPSSISSISSILNKNFEQTKMDLYFKKDQNYFSDYKFIKNETFDKFQSISVYQNMHINYCEHLNVIKCNQYNPFKTNKFTDGFKNTFLSRMFSIYNLQGSIFFHVISRVFRELNLIDLLISPMGNKASFENLLQILKKDIKSKKFDLIFVHTMTPHKPYGFDENCKYDGRKSIGNYNIINYDETTYRHNIDRICTVNFLKNFIQELDNENYLKKLEIFFFQIMAQEL